MKICDLVTIQKNRNNNQVSFNLKARQLAKIGITPQYLLNIHVPNGQLIKKPKGSHKMKKEVKHKWN